MTHNCTSGSSRRCSFATERLRISVMPSKVSSRSSGPNSARFDKLIDCNAGACSVFGSSFSHGNGNDVINVFIQDYCPLRIFNKHRSLGLHDYCAFVRAFIYPIQQSPRTFPNRSNLLIQEAKRRSLPFRRSHVIFISVSFSILLLLPVDIRAIH